MSVVTAISIYPIKSCRGLSLDSARVEARGLQADRRYMVVDANGHFVTQRQFPKMALIELAQVDGGWSVSSPGHASIVIPTALNPGEGGATVCKVNIWRQAVEATLADPATNLWLSSVMGFACGLVYLADDQHRPVQNAAAEFDDEVSFADGAPVLLISESSLSGLNEQLGAPVSMAHFRPNIVVSADTPHAEDSWRDIAMGDTQFSVAWPCSRCVLTTVNPQTGERRSDREPMQTLRTYRRRGQSVYFGQNLLVRQPGAIAVGDRVEILSGVQE